MDDHRVLHDTAVWIGQEIVKHAASAWMNHRRANDDRAADLVDLLTIGITDQFHRRKLARQLEDVGDQVSQRLLPLLEQENRLPEHERRAAIDAVTDALSEADLSDRGLFDADLDPLKLASQVRQRVPNQPAAARLNEAATVLYERILDECCLCLVSVVRELPEFQPRALAELLSRVSVATEQIERILERLPRTGLTSVQGDDAEFTHRYLRQVSETLDRLELFGIDTHHYRPRTSVSLAYLSLSVAESWRQQDRPDPHRYHTRTSPATDGLRIEHALGEHSRTLLRGDAGSGKTTVLQWLAINAARGSFTGPLTRWNGLVPFVVWLREHPEGVLPQPEDLVASSAAPLAGQMPHGWAHRQFANRNALLLVDGVDELSTQQRTKVRQWLDALIVAFPDTPIIVTSRPAAVEAQWLDEQGFASCLLGRMTPSDVDVFCRRWHDAIRAAARNGAQLPCDPDEITEFEAALIRQVHSKTHLRSLATNPLMCAMLCALNLDRRKQLPTDRMRLYDAALEMLVERRDNERDIPATAGVSLDSRAKIELVQYVAWWLTQCGRAELSISEAEQRIGYALSRMPDIDEDAETVTRYLVERSGVLREPRMGSVDFVHRTFQEYLAGKQAAEEELADHLVLNAHLDQWHETVVMAAGHGTHRFRDQLLTDLLDRAVEQPRHARKLRLVAASCLDNTRVVAPEVATRAEDALDQLVPPRNDREARSLALTGQRLLRHLPDRLDTLKESAAVACVRAATGVGGTESLDLLSAYATDPRGKVQSELMRSWKYYEPAEYARRVLADAPLRRGTLIMERLHHIPYLSRIRHLQETLAELRQDHVNDLTALDEVPNLVSVWLSTDQPLDLAPLAQHRQLRTVMIPTVCENLPVLAELPELAFLSAGLPAGADDLAFSTRFTNLRRLDFWECQDITDVTPIGELNLTTLGLWKCWRLDDVGPLANLRRLQQLHLNAAPFRGGLTALEPLLSRLEFINLHSCPTITELAPLRSATNLAKLWLSGCPVSDLGPLAELPELTDLAIPWTTVTDIEPLVDLPRLNRLDLRGLPPELDLRPLRRRPARAGRLEVWLRPGQRARGVPELGKRVRIRRR